MCAEVVVNRRESAGQTLGHRFTLEGIGNCAYGERPAMMDGRDPQMHMAPCGQPKALRAATPSSAHTSTCRGEPRCPASSIGWPPRADETPPPPPPALTCLPPPPACTGHAPGTPANRAQEAATSCAGQPSARSPSVRCRSRKKSPRCVSSPRPFPRGRLLARVQWARVRFRSGGGVRRNLRAPSGPPADREQRWSRQGRAGIRRGESRKQAGPRRMSSVVTEDSSLRTAQVPASQVKPHLVRTDASPGRRTPVLKDGPAHDACIQSPAIERRWSASRVTSNLSNTRQPHGSTSQITWAVRRSTQPGGRPFPPAHVLGRRADRNESHYCVSLTGLTIESHSMWHEINETKKPKYIAGVTEAGLVTQ